MNDALQKMNVLLGNAEAGGTAAAASLNSLGLSASILKDLSLDQQFALIVRQINRLEDSAQRAAAVQDIFGRGASELGNLLNLTAEDFAQYTNQINGSAASLSATQIAELKKAQNAVEELSRSWAALQTQVAAASAPVLTQAVNDLNETAKDPISAFKLFGFISFATPEDQKPKPPEPLAPLQNVPFGPMALSEMLNPFGSSTLDALGTSRDVKPVRLVNARRARYVHPKRNHRWCQGRRSGNRRRCYRGNRTEFVACRRRGVPLDSRFAGRRRE
jgi:hypothetical protein